MRGVPFGLAVVAAVVGMAGCGGSDDADDSGGPGVTLRIDAPRDGAWYDEGEPVDFQASAWSDDGAEVPVDAATWTLVSGAEVDWSAEGVSFTATDLPAGDLEIRCDAEAGGRTLQASVGFQVWATVR